MPRSWFYLTLDTTPPDVEIGLPSYVTQQAITPIFIHGTEELGDVVELYTIDKDDIRRDYIFEHQGDKLYGEIDFDTYPLGFVELFVQVMDVVDNVSPLRSAIANIVEAADLSIVTRMMVRNMSDGIGVRRMLSDMTVRKITDRVVDT